MVVDGIGISILVHDITLTFCISILFYMTGDAGASKKEFFNSHKSISESSQLPYIHRINVRRRFVECSRTKHAGGGLCWMVEVPEDVVRPIRTVSRDWNAGDLRVQISQTTACSFHLSKSYKLSAKKGMGET